MPPSAGYAPLAQTSGRIKLIVVADVTTTDLQTSTGTTATDVTIQSWKLRWNIESFGKVVTVESTSDASGARALYGDVLAGGIGAWEVSVRTVENSESTAGGSSYEHFHNGTFLKFDLIRHKTRGSGYGHFGCFGRVVSDDTDGCGITGDPQVHEYKIAGSGVLPTPSFIA